MSSNLLYYTSPNGTVYLATGNNANCTISVCPATYSVYGYRPSIALSSTLIALYGIVIAVQLVLCFRYKSWGYTVAMVLGCIDEILGYVGRILLWRNPWKHIGFIMQIGTLLIDSDRSDPC